LLMCKIIKARLESEKFDVIYYNAKVQYDIKTEESVNAYNHLSILNDDILTGMEYLEISFPRNYIVSACIAVYKKCFLEKYNILFPEGIYYEDHYFCLQVVSNAEKVLCIEDALYVRRCRENSTTTGAMDEKRCCDIVSNQKILWNYLLSTPNWLFRTELLRRFTAQMVLNAFYNISKYTDKTIVEEKKEEITRIFLNNGLFLYLKAEYSWSESLPFLLVLRQAEKIDCNSKEECMIKDFFGTNDRFLICKRQAKFELERNFIQKIAAIPMNQKGVKVGIYGVGRHTAEFMDMYQRYFGNIECELFFVVTECKRNMHYGNQSVISFSDIPMDTYCIVLSSLPYQEEMRKNLLLQGVDEKKIVLLYEKNDICDLIMVNWVLYQLESEGRECS